LRFGERLPNLFGEGEMTLWFHPACAAYKRPEALLEAAGDAPPEALAPLLPTARLGVAHRRLPRVDGAERAPSGRARCRHCRELIARGAWRLRLVYFESFRFEPSGFVHAACAGEYLGTTEVAARARHFSAELGDEDVADLEAALGAGGADSA
jgi:hypothetical protein